ncbi:hypothetical protein F25303_4601 [Fusarium sp. NRRL 25303]|nr:hypothetical protein F25303_4601 [Fusarium sp. NRRL 25303]
MESTQQVEKQSAQETSSASTGEKFADLVFPDLGSPLLSQELEDQASLGRLKLAWDKFASGWSPQDKKDIYRLLPKVRTNLTNRKVPSKHKLYKREITFGRWVILQCMYPNRKLQALRLTLMEKYPGIDLGTFAGPVPNAACMAPQEHIAGNSSSSPSDLSLKEEGYTSNDNVFHIPKFEPHLDQLRSTGTDKPSAQRLKEVQLKMRGMVIGEPHSASYSKFLQSKSSTAPVDVSTDGSDITKLCVSPSAVSEADVESLASDGSPPKDDCAHTAISNKRFLELKNLITNVTTESKRCVSDEMRKLHIETTKQIQNMHTEMTEQFKKNGETLIDIGEQVAETRAHIELARMDRKDLDEVETRVINLEQFILSL